MGKVIRFEIIGRPQGKGRPRFRRVGNYVSTYNPKTTQTYENLVKNSVLEQCKDEFDSEYTGAIKVLIQAIFRPNKSTSKKKYKELLNTPYLHKPDFDNIAKIICDSLNGIAYKDDNQICEATVEKWYGIEDKVIVSLEYYDYVV